MVVEDEDFAAEEEVGDVSEMAMDDLSDPDEDLAPLTHGELRIDFLDVGQGDSTLIRCPNGFTILVDGGALPRPSVSKQEDFRTKLLNLLGNPTLDVLLVTHPDRDHYSMLRRGLRNIKVSHVVYGGELADYGSFESWIQAFINKGQATSPLPRYFDPVGSPNSLFDCGSAEVWILAANVPPPANETGSSFLKNTLSIVLKIVHGDFETILTGDATHYTESEVLSNYSTTLDFVEADVLKLGHHGSRSTSNKRPWIEAVKPKAAVASCGANNSYGHPSVDAMYLLPATTENQSGTHKLRWCVGPGGCGTSRVDEAIYSTPFAGDIRIVSNGSGFQLTCEKSEGC